MQTLEKTKYQWQFAADSMPQLICLLDGDGRVIHANRTVERWKLGSVESVSGLHLHDLLHRRCKDPACYLRLFGQHAAAELSKERRAESDVWDPVLKRHIVIRTQLPVRTPEQEASSEDFFAVVTVDDVTELRAGENKARQEAKSLGERVERETEGRAQAEKVQSRLLAILDKSPNFVAMADRSGALFYINPAGRELLKLGSQDEIAGMTLSNCHAPGMRERLDGEAMSHAMREGVWTGDSVLLARDRHEVRTVMTLIAHRDRDGQLEGFTSLERNMTDWIRTEEALRVSHIQLRRLSAQHLTIQETERQRIAADLHDGLGQSLSLLKLSVEAAAKSVSARISAKAAKHLEELVPKVKSVLDELRGVAMNLRPSIIDDLGIRATLSWFFREFEASGVKTKIERDISVNESDVPQPLKIAIFRILQEATNNALKHARADRIKVSLGICSAGETLEFSIADNGKGFDPAGVVGTGGVNRGLGLQTMRERAELSGADFDMKSAPGKGTRILVRWPSTKALERNVAALPHRTVQAIRYIPVNDPGQPQHLAKSAQGEIENFLFCAACRTSR
jgi:PAS domain S-box-containing protein